MFILKIDMNKSKIFLCYAREDIDMAKRIYQDLKMYGLDIWFDTESLEVGQLWENAILDAIEESDFCIAVLSSNSMTKKGYVQKELKTALNVIDLLPENRTYIMPVRIDDCLVKNRQLKRYHWIDVFPENEYENGIKAILKVVYPDNFILTSKSQDYEQKKQQEYGKKIVQEIYQGLIPREVPDIEGYEIYPYYEAAKELSGDYYDFFEVDKYTLAIVVADVSDKGLPGSLVMKDLRKTLRTETRWIKSASEVLARVNDIVVDDIMKKGMFVTLFYVIIDSKQRRINYASAGHNPMILYRQRTNKTYYLNPRGFPVGISLPDADLFKKSIESDTIQLSEDDILLLYTDGITEAMNSRREMFGEERLLDVIRKSGHLKAEEFIKTLKVEINSFTEGHEQSDDITVVAIKEKSTPEKIELKGAQTAHQMIMKGMSIREACEEAGIGTYAYFNKYKKIFEEEGIDAYSIDGTLSVEAKHLSIEEKTKIYNIIKKHPEFGAKRISEELNTAEYSFTQINESRIYDELVRSYLNTRQLREAHIARSGKKNRMKPPGTPMLTLDGKIIFNKDMETFEKQTPTPAVARERKAVPEKQAQPIKSKKQEEVKLPKDSDVADGDDIGFDMLTSEMSFKDEIFMESNRDDGKILPEEEENLVSPVKQTKSGQIRHDDLIDELESHESVKIDDDDLLAEDDRYEVTDFSYNDLLEEIESDISFFDEENINEDEVEFAYENHSQVPKIKQMPNNENLRKIDDRAIVETTTSEPFKLEQHDRLREKHLVLGLKFYQEQNYDQAIEQLLKVVNLYPDFKEAYSVLGNAYYRNNQIEKAIEAYQRVKQIDPFDEDAYENTGVIYANMGKLKDAIKEWNTLLEFRPDRKDVLNHIEKAKNLLEGRGEDNSESYMIK